jgi:protein-disulfide isomerase
MSMRIPGSMAVAPALLALVATAGCQGPDTADAAGPGASAERPGGGAAPGDDPVAAVIGGDPVHLSEVDAAIAGELVSLEQQIYELRRAELERLVERRLFEAEARARGIDLDELLQVEIAAKAGDVTEEAMTQLYEQHKARLGGRTRKEMVPQLYLAVQERNQAARRRAFADDLAARADVELRLPPPRAELEVPANAPTLGASGAEITIVAFSDYQCPYCHRAQTTVEEVLDRYQGRVKLVHMDFPLNIHPGAIPAASAARCAGEQQRFWEYHRDLLSRLTDFSEEDLMSRAKRLGLQEEAFATCLASDRYEAVIDAGFRQGQQLGVKATPTFFINGRRLEGAQPLERFAEIIDEELARSDS